MMNSKEMKRDRISAIKITPQIVFENDKKKQTKERLLLYIIIIIMWKYKSVKTFERLSKIQPEVPNYEYSDAKEIDAKFKEFSKEASV